MARVLVLALAAFLAATAAAAAEAPAPAPAADCLDALVGLAGCLSYVEAGSTVATPDPSCCSGLKDVVKHQVACLCQVFQGGGQNFGISINMTKALQLPAACKVKTPPVSKCHVSVPGVPSASPEAGAPFFGQPPSSPSPSGSSPAASAAATGTDSNTPAPSPAAHSGTASLSASSPSFFSAAAAVAAALLVYRVL